MNNQSRNAWQGSQNIEGGKILPHANAKNGTFLRKKNLSRRLGSEKTYFSDPYLRLKSVLFCALHHRDLYKTARCELETKNAQNFLDFTVEKKESL